MCRLKDIQIKNVAYVKGQKIDLANLNRKIKVNVQKLSQFCKITNFTKLTHLSVCRDITFLNTLLF